MYMLLGATSIRSTEKSEVTHHDFHNDTIAIIDAGLYAMAHNYVVWLLFNKNGQPIYHSKYGIL